jgi:RNA polymerase sigma-70 factor (ECF subfamily)
LRSALTALFQIETQKAPKVEDAIVQNERDQAVYESLNMLDEKHRTVIVLRYFHELSVAEIAEILSVNEGAVHSRLHYARERLRLALAPLNGEQP